MGAPSKNTHGIRKLRKMARWVPLPPIYIGGHVKLEEARHGHWRLYERESLISEWVFMTEGGKRKMLQEGRAQARRWDRYRE